MPESMRYCLISLVALFSGLCIVSCNAHISKEVCEGDYVQLFQNITLTNHSTLNLWINGVRKTLIGTWTSSQKPVIIEGYMEKIYLDDYGTIWIRNIQLSEDGTYLLQYNTDPLKSEVKINVMVAPTKQCIPKIMKTGNVLKASLDAKDCGRPLASVKWMNHPNVSVISDSVAMLHSDKAFGFYIACAETAAQRCVRNLRLTDYCSHLTINEQLPIQEIEVVTEKDKDKSVPFSSDISDVKIIGFIMASVILLVVVFTSITGLTIIIRRNKKMENFMTTMETRSWVSNVTTRTDEDETTNLLLSSIDGRSEIKPSPQNATN